MTTFFLNADADLSLNADSITAITLFKEDSYNQAPTWGVTVASGDRRDIVVEGFSKAEASEYIRALSSELGERTRAGGLVTHAMVLLAMDDVAAEPAPKTLVDPLPFPFPYATVEAALAARVQTEPFTPAGL